MKRLPLAWMLVACAGLAGCDTTFDCEEPSDPESIPPSVEISIVVPSWAVGGSIDVERALHAAHLRQQSEVGCGAGGP